MLSKKQYIVQTYYPFNEINAYGPLSSKCEAESLKKRLEMKERANNKSGFSAQVIELEKPPSYTMCL